MRANHPFTAGPAGWDQLELLARHAELEIDEHAFPLFAHSIATARRADTVVWLDDGRVRAVGPHSELWDDDDYRAVFG